MNDGTGMDNMTAVIVKLRPTFDENKAAKNLLADEGCSSTPANGSSSSASLSTSNISSSKPTSSTDKITEPCRASSNGQSSTPISSFKRTLDSISEESSSIETQCSKKAKLDEKEDNIASKSNQPTFVQP